jgi:hypothetical protein
VDLSRVMPQVNLFRRLPGATVILIPHADHYLFKTNEDEVLREIRSFIQAKALNP